MVTGLVICHGQLAFEIIDATQKIVGSAEGVYPFTNEDLDNKGLHEKLYQVIREHSSEHIIAMVDLRGGSCWTVAKMLTREFPQLKIVTGINIPMLISFLTKREKLAFEELPQVLKEDAHRGIVSE